jgi:hypothetical protein
MDEDDLDTILKFLSDCDGMLIVGIRNKELVLWHSPDADDMKVLDMLLQAYQNFYMLANEKPLH